MKKITFTACSALFLTGCGAQIAHTTHHERTLQAQTASKNLSERYQQLQKEELKLAPLQCSAVKRADTRAQKALNHLQANAVHPHQGQSVLHVPTHLEISNATNDLNRLSSEIAECQNVPTPK